MADSPYDPPVADVDPPHSDGAAMERPKEIVIAISLAALAFAINWLAAIVNWDDQQASQSPGAFLVGQAVGVAIAAFVYFKIFQGRNWARILLLVFSVFGWLMLLVPGVWDTLALLPTFSKVVVALNHLIQLMILWLLFFSPGRYWFRKI